MLRVYWKLASWLVMILIGCNLLTRPLGHAQPPNPALRGFIEGCAGQPQPCWYGIVPGVTTPSDAQEIAHRYGFSVEDVSSGTLHQMHVVASACMALLNHTHDFYTPIYELGLTMCNGIQMGDLIQLWGKPDGLCVHYGRILVLFHQGATNILLKDHKHISPYSEVSVIGFSDEPYRLAKLWTGFRLGGGYRMLKTPDRGCWD